MNKFSTKILLLILVHLLIFNILFTFRFSPTEFYKNEKLWNANQFHGTPLNYLKLYLSRLGDESYYYEWSGFVLGKNLDPEFLQVRRKKIIDSNEPEKPNTIQSFFTQTENLVPSFKKDPQNDAQFLKYSSDPPHFRLPYRDIPFEYPPILIIPLLSAQYLSVDYLSFTKWLAFFISIIYLFALYVTYKIWQQISPQQRVRYPLLLLFSSLSILSIGQIFVTRLDIFPSLISLLILYSFLKQKYMLFSIWLIVGFFTKGYLIILAPILWIILLHQKKYSEILWNILFVSGAILTIHAELNFLSQGHFNEMYTYHSQRGIQIESTYALIPYLSHFLFKTPILIYQANHCSNISAASTHFLLQLSTFLPFILFLLVYFLLYLTFRKTNTVHQQFLLITQAVFLLILAFILSFKVLSPQFLIWLIPLIFISVPSQKIAFLIVFIFALIFTHILFPNFYFLLRNGHPLGIGLLISRNLILLILFGWVTNEFIQNIRQKPVQLPIQAI